MLHEGRADVHLADRLGHPLGRVHRGVDRSVGKDVVQLLHHSLGATVLVEVVVDEGDPPGGQKAPFPVRTAGMVRSRMRRSSPSDQFSMYVMSSSTCSANPSSLRPVTCHRPVMPGSVS